MLKFHLGSIRLGTNCDFAKFFLILQTLGHAHCVGELGTRRCRFSAELATRNNYALGTDRIHDFWNRYTQVRESVGLYPDTHRIVAGTDDVNTTNTLDPGQGILDID